MFDQIESLFSFLPYPERWPIVVGGAIFIIGSLFWPKTFMAPIQYPMIWISHVILWLPYRLLELALRSFKWRLSVEGETLTFWMVWRGWVRQRLEKARIEKVHLLITGEGPMVPDAFVVFFVSGKAPLVLGLEDDFFPQVLDWMGEHLDGFDSLAFAESITTAGFFYD